ncbi:MAG TPA: DEAD/DEAH box helicase, partial [Halobacteriales archaeon]|nr:DEAD/DEAH box helicase [Halobacteriales archaeon]
MDQIHAALERGRDVLFEGACGTGKTLAALAPALEYGRRSGKAVVITTNVHQQMRQFVSEARAITETEPIRSVVFRGKASMCHIDVGYEECRALRETTRDLVEAEREQRELERRERQLTDEIRDGAAVGGESGGGPDGSAAGPGAGASN